MVVFIIGNLVCCDYWVLVYLYYSFCGEWYLFRVLYLVDLLIVFYFFVLIIFGFVVYDCCDIIGISLFDFVFGCGECVMCCFCLLVFSVFRFCL